MLIFLLACYGLAFTICDAKLFRAPRMWVRSRFRFFDELLSCYFCTGFWVSLSVAILAYWFEYPILISKVWQCCFYGFAGASFCYGLDAVIRWLEARTPNGCQNV
jgi:hypothetical protein